MKKTTQNKTPKLIQFKLIGRVVSGSASKHSELYPSEGIESDVSARTVAAALDSWNVDHPDLPEELFWQIEALVNRLYQYAQTEVKGA